MDAPNKKHRFAVRCVGPKGSVLYYAERSDSVGNPWTEHASEAKIFSDEDDPIRSSKALQVAFSMIGSHCVISVVDLNEEE